MVTARDSQVAIQPPLPSSTPTPPSGLTLGPSSLMQAWPWHSPASDSMVAPTPYRMARVNSGSWTASPAPFPKAGAITPPASPFNPAEPDCLQRWALPPKLLYSPEHVLLLLLPQGIMPFLFCPLWLTPAKEPPFPLLWSGNSNTYFQNCTVSTKHKGQWQLCINKSQFHSFYIPPLRILAQRRNSKASNVHKYMHEWQSKDNNS